jgi:hypothetical protein
MEQVLAGDVEDLPPPRSTRRREGGEATDLDAAQAAEDDEANEAADAAKEAGVQDPDEA